MRFSLIASQRRTVFFVAWVIAGSEARVLCESSDEAQVIARSEARELWESSDEAQVIARSEAGELWESSDEAIFLVCWVRAFSECSLLRQWE